MAREIVIAPALVLSLAPSGERFVQIKALSPGQGLTTVLQRISAKNVDSKLDLYDLAELVVTLKERDDFGFLKQSSSLAKHPGLGRSYARLRSAAEISALITKNPIHEENAEPLFHTALKALRALEAGACPESVIVKTLYLYCRDEGIPVLEDWQQSLTPEQKEKARHIIHTPLAELATSPLDAQEILGSLKLYIEHETPIRLA